METFFFFYLNPEQMVLFVLNIPMCVGALNMSKQIFLSRKVAFNCSQHSDGGGGHKYVKTNISKSKGVLQLSFEQMVPFVFNIPMWGGGHKTCQWVVAANVKKNVPHKYF